MERNAEVLRRDARAPLCLKPLPRWRYEHAFRRTLRRFLAPESDLFLRGVECLTAHHAYAQEFVETVDQVIVSETPTVSRIRGALVSLLGTSSRLLQLEGSESLLEEIREKLADRFRTEGGSLPEFRWEKGAADLFFRKVREAGVETEKFEAALFVHLNDVYDDAARTVQLGLWIMAATWRAEVVDTWLFESAYMFFNHTIPRHLAGPEGLVALIPEVIGLLETSAAP